MQNWNSFSRLTSIWIQCLRIFKFDFSKFPWVSPVTVSKYRISQENLKCYARDYDIKEKQYKLLLSHLHLPQMCLGTVCVT